MVASGVLPEQLSMPHSSASLQASRGLELCVEGASTAPVDASIPTLPADLASRHESLLAAEHLYCRRLEDAASWSRACRGPSSSLPARVNLAGGSGWKVDQHRQVME